MSVYTSISVEEITSLLEKYEVGTLLDYEGVPSGVTNSNYVLTTTHGKFFLIIFEQQDMAGIQFYINIVSFLHQHDFPCPEVICDKNNHRKQSIRGKFAVLTEYIEAEHVLYPEQAHIRSVASVLARMHILLHRFPIYKENPRGLAWQQEAATNLYDNLSSSDKELVSSELEFQLAQPYADLPSGVIHADLFRDNVFFQSDTVVSIIDYDFICRDPYLLDIAICINDWCLLSHDSVDSAKQKAFLEAYHQVRPLSGLEIEIFPAMLRRAACRFWLSRLWDFHHQAETDLVTIHDPSPMRDLLTFHRSSIDDKV